MLTLLPDPSELLRLSPQYNAATLVELAQVELARAAGARDVLWLSAPDPEHPARDAFVGAGIQVTTLAPDWAWAEAERAQLQDFLNQYPQGRERLKQAARAEEGLREVLLAAPLSLARLTDPALLGAVRGYHAAVRAALDEGPGTAWRARRLAELRAALEGREGVALAALDDLPALLEALPEARLPDPSAFTPGEASRLRALADRAERLEEEDDLDALLGALLREAGDAVTPKAELQYAAANIYLAVGELASARELLEASAHAQLPGGLNLTGLILARLGQVRDAQGERDLARRAYQATLALTHAPEVARAAAQAGLEAPFGLEGEALEES